MAVLLVWSVITHVRRSLLIVNALDEEVSLFMLGMTKHNGSVFVLKLFPLQASGTRRPLIESRIDLAVSVDAKHAHFVNPGIILLLPWVVKRPLPFFLVLGNLMIGHPYKVCGGRNRGNIRMTQGGAESLPTHQEPIRLLARGRRVLIQRDWSRVNRHVRLVEIICCVLRLVKVLFFHDYFLLINLISEKLIWVYF